MLSWTVRKILNLVYGSSEENVNIREDFEGQRMISAKKMFHGDRTFPEIHKATSRTGKLLSRRYVHIY